MANEYKNNGGNDNSELISWLIVVGGLVIFWPVGLVLLFMKLKGTPIYTGSSKGARQSSNNPYSTAQERPGAWQSGSQNTWQAQSAPTGQEKAQGQEKDYTYHYKYEYHYQGQGQRQNQNQQQSQNRQQTQKSSQQQNQSRQQAKYQPQYRPAAAQRGGAAPGMQGVPNQGRYKYHKSVNLNRGRAMTVWGAILTGIFGLATITTIPLLLMEGMGAFFGAGTPILGFLSLGIILLASGAQRNKKAKRFRKYLALIGRRESIAISSLAQAMPVSYQTACDDLQSMLDEGYIPTGYLDMASGRLILSDEGLRDEAPRAEAEEAYQVDMEEEEVVCDDAFLDEIKQINDSIADEEMSRKIDRIGEITAKILDYQRKNPGKAGQLRSFLNYYLPTTLKILRAYAQMEAQGIEGENIRSAKNRIEGMMDKVVEGFEKQLDKLFQDDAMDITTDVEVLERMLDKDGLSGAGDMFQMGG